MSVQPTTFDLQTLRRFIRAVKALLTSEVRLNAIALLIFLLAFALSINGLNVVSSYVGRDFMTSIAHREMAAFIRLAILYVGLFAVMTAVAVFYRFAEERLGLLWRSWLTSRVTDRYLEARAYLRLKESAEIQNPDQRIAEDTRAFTTTTLSFALIFLNSTLAAISFSGVLWTISPLLFVVALGYAALGTVMTVLLGRPLVGLNYRQSDREADF
jgi:putative ATP-binding cassette transporter